jgi:hypothetical protein
VLPAMQFLALASKAASDGCYCSALAKCKLVTLCLWLRPWLLL